MKAFNPAILRSDVQQYLRDHEGADIHRLLLSGSPFPDVTAAELAVQLSARLKARQKLPAWYTNPGIYFPEGLHLEQSSSEATALYKAQLVKAGHVIDLTGGLGVDSYYFSRQAERVTYLEINETLAGIARHNFEQLGATNIVCMAADGLAWLIKERPRADLIYADPSRRGKQRQRVFRLSECEPDLTAHLPQLFDFAPDLLIKTSPLLDLSAGINELGFVKEIHVVALEEEVKEVLWLLQKSYAGPILVKTVHFKKSVTQEFEFQFEKEKTLGPMLSKPGKFLYEPNGAIMKSGGFNSLSKQFQMPKLHEHSHLYTDDVLHPFPGRVFRILRVLPYNPKKIRDIGYAKANVATRNFPLPVATLRKKLKIADGGSMYLFFTRTSKEQLIMIECEKI